MDGYAQTLAPGFAPRHGGVAARLDMLRPQAGAGPLGGAFGTHPMPGRPLDAGMGLAVGRRTVFRPEDAEDFGRVAERVSAGNTALAPTAPGEREALRNAIATGALLTSGRHLQHGDAEQPKRNMEVFTNCATAITSFAEFYLLLNGSGVGRAYDDELAVVDWAWAPDLRLHLSPEHPDFPATRDTLRRFGVEMGLLPWGTDDAGFDAAAEAAVRAFLEAELVSDLATIPAGAVVHRVADSREGWAKAVEVLDPWPSAGSGRRPCCSTCPMSAPPARRSAACRGARPPGRSRCCAG